MLHRFFRCAVPALLAALIVAGSGSAVTAQSDSMIHVKSFPGGDVGTMTANAMRTCPAAPIPCILVIDASLAAYAPGTMPTLCATCSLADYRTGSILGLPGVTPDGSNGINVAGSISTESLSITGPPVWSAQNGLGFIGDSLSCIQGSWADLVQAQSLQKEWTLFSGNLGAPSWNQCESGQNTAYMLNTELPAILALNPRPNFVSILGGTNDVIEGVPPATTLAQIQTIATKSQAGGVKPILNTIPPNNNGFAVQVYQLNWGVGGSPSAPKSPSIASLASANNWPLVDNWSAMAANPAGPCTSINSSACEYAAGYSSDGTHPNTYPGMTTWATNWITQTNSLFASGSVWLPTAAFDRLNLIPDPFVSDISNWLGAEYSNYTTAPSYSSVSCALADGVGNCFQAVITTDGNQSHYAEFGFENDADADAGDLMAAIVPYAIGGMNALGGWEGGTAGLIISTGADSDIDPYVQPWPQIWQDCTKCYLAVEYTQPPVPVSGHNVGLEMFFGGSTNSGTVTLQFARPAILDLTKSTLGASFQTFTEPNGTSGNSFASVQYVDNMLQVPFTGVENCENIGSGSSGQPICSTSTGTGDVVHASGPYIQSPTISNPSFSVTGLPSGCAQLPCEVAVTAPTSYSGSTTQNALTFASAPAGTYLVCGTVQVTTAAASGTAIYLTPIFTANGASQSSMNFAADYSPATLNSFGSSCATLEVDASTTIYVNLIFSAISGTPTTRYSTSLMKIR